MKRRGFIQKSSLLAVGSLALSSFKSEDVKLKIRIRPKGLQKGDLVAVTAPAGAIFNSHQISKFESKLSAYKNSL